MGTNQSSVYSVGTDLGNKGPTPAAQRQRVQPPLVTGQARYTTNDDTPAKYYCSRRV